MDKYQGVLPDGGNNVWNKVFLNMNLSIFTVYSSCRTHLYIVVWKDRSKLRISWHIAARHFARLTLKYS